MVVVEFVVSFFLILGAFFALTGSIGLYRMTDFFSRLHGPTKSTTLGVGGMALASAVYFSFQGNGISLHEVLITLFLFITAPVSAHFMAKAARHQRMHENKAALPPGCEKKTGPHV
ncbi:MAG: Na+/H+ antiporter subunit G [Desulfotignum sp.]|nr:Na+/H+ antiporter subunit G [Desulfotignum sp.]MCF8125693.1 Na+/H+ antiporter subunit G [Desulfotignum sp.]